MKIQIVTQIPENKEIDREYLLCADINKVENNSCMEIILTDILDYISQRNEFLMICLNKLRHNGTLSLSGIDIVEISKQIFFGQITIDEANYILYNGKASSDNLFKLINFFDNSNMYTVIDKRLTNYTYFIKVQKI